MEVTALIKQWAVVYADMLMYREILKSLSIMEKMELDDMNAIAENIMQNLFLVASRPEMMALLLEQPPNHTHFHLLNFPSNSTTCFFKLWRLSKRNTSYMYLERNVRPK